MCAPRKYRNKSPTAFRLKAQGYKFVEFSDQPDLVVVLDADNTYKESYIPPQSYKVPVYVPGRTITTNSNLYGTYGNYYGTSTTYEPGYFTSETYTKPGKTVGYFYPSVSVSVFESSGYQNVWSGIGVGTSGNADLRVSTQLVLSSVLAAFPVSGAIGENYPAPSGYLGIQYVVLTVNGNDFYPFVSSVEKDSPAQKAGLRVEDVIVSINGSSTQNKSWGEIYAMLSGDAGQSVSIGIARADGTKTLELSRASK